ncbi:unnamed protein product [Toxocara canis]|uniref:DDE_Tnp_1_7 domain-containing protein n=1 Tax=Toxocara canis TaxID=6265 RepID=A0A183UXB3_TOXCA|nr:unnamed protein product [Toxocara canis]
MHFAPDLKFVSDWYFAVISSQQGRPHFFTFSFLFSPQFFESLCPPSFQPVGRVLYEILVGEDTSIRYANQLTKGFANPNRDQSDAVRNFRSGALIVAVDRHDAESRTYRSSGTEPRPPPDETSDSNAQTITAPQHRTATKYVRRRQQPVPSVLLPGRGNVGLVKDVIMGGRGQRFIDSLNEGSDTVKSYPGYVRGYRGLRPFKIAFCCMDTFLRSIKS